MFDWNDLRYFLAVARTGSTLSASKQMKVSQATVSRRVTVLEEALGTALFTRKPSGYALTPRGEAVRASAEAVEAAVQAFADKIAAETRRLVGTVRITTVEAAANEWLIPALPAFNRRHPEVKVDIDASQELLDIARGEADIAIRFGPMPTQESLIVRHLLDMEQTVYASPQLAADKGLPEDTAALARYPFIIFGGAPQSLSNDWLVRTVPGVTFAHTTNSNAGLIASVRAGLGATILPCLVGDNDPALTRLLPPVRELTTQAWLVTTDAARKLPHVRAVLDYLVEVVLVSFQQYVAQQAATKAA